MTHLFLFAAIACNVAGQYVLKAGVNSIGGTLSLNFVSLFKAFTSLPVLAGFLIYGVGSVFWILTLSRTELSYAYPLLSLGYIAVIVISWFVLGETISATRAAGAFLYLLAIFLIFSSA